VVRVTVLREHEQHGDVDACPEQARRVGDEEFVRPANRPHRLAFAKKYLHINLLRDKAIISQDRDAASKFSLDCRACSLKDSAEGS
jgi:hypothetical protein